MLSSNIQGKALVSAQGRILSPCDKCRQNVSLLPNCKNCMCLHYSLPSQIHEWLPTTPRLRQALPVPEKNRTLGNPCSLHILPETYTEVSYTLRLVRDRQHGTENEESCTLRLVRERQHVHKPGRASDMRAHLQLLSIHGLQRCLGSHMSIYSRAL